MLVGAACVLGLLRGLRPAVLHVAPDDGGGVGGVRHPVMVHLSNQSFRHPWIRVRVTVDGREILDTRLFVGRQHTRKDVMLHLATGPHTIHVERVGTGAELETAFEVGSPTWIAIRFWEGSEGGADYFKTDIQGVPFAFD